MRASLDTLAPQWDRLVDQTDLPSPFLYSWWLEHAAAGQPVILTVHRGDALIGGVAFEIDGRSPVPRYLSLGSALAPDHVDLVAAAGERAAVVEAVGAWAAAHRHAAFDLSLLRPASGLAEAIPGAASRIIEAAPYVALPGDAGAYLASRPSRLRNTLDRTRRRLDKAGVTYRRSEPSEVERDLSSLETLHAAVFGERSLFLPEYRRFARVARAAAPTGGVVFHRLERAAEVIAITVMLEGAGRTSYYQVGRRPEHEWRGCGALLELRIIEDACQRGLEEFDHLRGTATYKQDWAPDSRPLARVTGRRGLGGRAVVAAAALLAKRRSLRGRRSA